MLHPLLKIRPKNKSDIVARNLWDVFSVIQKFLEQFWDTLKEHSSKSKNKCAHEKSFKVQVNQLKTTCQFIMNLKNIKLNQCIKFVRKEVWCNDVRNKNPSFLNWSKADTTHDIAP